MHKYNNFKVHKLTTPSHLGMVVHKYPNIVSIGHDTGRNVRPRPFSMHVDTRAAEGGVSEVAVVDGRFAVGWDVEAVESLSCEAWGRSIKLEEIMRDTV